MTAHNPVEWTGRIRVEHRPRAAREVTFADVLNLPSFSRTWCGRFRCCREKNHVGSCEIDVTMLDHPELAAIAASRRAA